MLSLKVERNNEKKTHLHFGWNIAMKRLNILVLARRWNSTQITAFALFAFAFINLYLYIQNTHQAGIVELLKRSNTKNEKFGSTSRKNVVHFKDLTDMKNQLLEQIKAKSPSESSKTLGISNQTVVMIDRLYKKLFSSEGELQLTIKSMMKQQSNDEDLEWLDRDDSKGFADYGDGSCPVTTDRGPWQKNTCQMDTNRKKTQHSFTSWHLASLLGAWRDEEVIPYDQDMDVRVHIDDFDKIYPLRQRKFCVGFLRWPRHSFLFHKRLAIALRCKTSIHLQRKKGWRIRRTMFFSLIQNARMIFRQWHMDIYAYVTYQDTVKFIPFSAPFEYRKDEIFPLTRCMFMGIETRCPKKAKAIFKNLYDSIKPTKKCFNKTWVEIWYKSLQNLNMTKSLRSSSVSSYCCFLFSVIFLFKYFVVGSLQSLQITFKTFVLILDKDYRKWYSCIRYYYLFLPWQGQDYNIQHVHKKKYPL